MRQIAALICAIAALVAVAVIPQAAADGAADVGYSPERAALDRAYELMRQGQGANAVPIFDAYLEEHPDDLDARLDFAYLLAEQGLRERAIEQMEAARGLDPRDPRIALQLAYWYLDAGREDDALPLLDAAAALDPEDARPRLQRAYLLDARGEHYDAYRDFYAASRSNDPQLAGAARQALRRMSLFGGAPQTEPWFGELYAEHRIAERFDTQAGSLIIRQGRKLVRGSPLEAYLTARVAWLNQEVTGAFPASVTDDSTIVGIGVRTRPLECLPNLTTYAEIGRVVDMPTQRLEDERTDFRAGFYYYDEWAPDAAPGRLYADGRVRNLYAEGAYYSRLGDNWIGYARYRYGRRVATSKRSALDLYAGLQVWADSRGDFYNNAVEVGPGLRYLPDLPGDWQITVEYIIGFYGRDKRTPRPFGSDYDDVRATVAVFSYF